MLILTRILLSGILICAHMCSGMASSFQKRLTQSEGFFAVYPWESIKKVYSEKDSRHKTYDIFDTIKDEAIANEKQYTGYCALYHATTIENFLLILFHTYLSQIKYNWASKNFYLLRNPDDLFDQNLSIKEFLEKYYFDDYLKNIDEYSGGFDHIDSVRKYLLSTNISFVGGTYNDFESSLYFFSHNRSILSTPYHVYEYQIIKKYNPMHTQKFDDQELRDAQYAVRYFIFKKIENLSTFLKTSRITSGSSGILFQIMIPENIVNDCTYICTGFGMPITQQIQGISDGWDSKLGFYFKTTPFLKILQTDPFLLNKTIISDKFYKHEQFNGIDTRTLPTNEHDFYALETLQARILLKKKYFAIELDEKKRLKNSIKMHVFHTMQQNVIATIMDMVYTLSRIIVEEANIFEKYKGEKFKEKYLEWYHSTDIENEKYYGKMGSGVFYLSKKKKQI